MILKVYNFLEQTQDPMDYLVPGQNIPEQVVSEEVLTAQSNEIEPAPAQFEEVDEIIAVSFVPLDTVAVNVELFRGSDDESIVSALTIGTEGVGEISIISSPSIGIAPNPNRQRLSNLNTFGEEEEEEVLQQNNGYVSIRRLHSLRDFILGLNGQTIECAFFYCDVQNKMFLNSDHHLCDCDFC